MDKANEMVRMVARAFYDTECVVIIDALVRHSACNLSDLQWIFQNSARAKNAAQIYCGHLKSGGLVSSQTRMETKANAQKPTAVEYYYIDPRRAVDATKYRLHTLEETLRRRAGPAEEKKEYSCPRCKSEWTELEVIDNPSEDGFLCHRCGHMLNYTPKDSEDAEATGPVGIFNSNLGWLIQLMRELDSVTIPEVTADKAFDNRVEVPRPKAPLEGPKTVVTSASVSKPQAVKGVLTGPQKIEVTITSDADNTAATQIAQAEQKERLARANALPEWHTHSTVSNEMTAAGQREAAARREREAELGLLNSDSLEEKKEKQDDDLAAVFAALEEEQRLAAQKQEQEDDEDDDEDEDEDEFEFEDVPSSLVNGNRSVNGEETAPESKKVKLDTPAGDTPITQASGSVEADDSEEEFEDV